MSRPSISPDPYVSAGARISHKLSRIAETWMNIRRKSSQTLLLNLEHLDADQLNHIQSVIDAFITPPISLPKAFSYAGSSTDTSSEESSQAALSTGTSSEESSQAALSTGTSFGWSDWGHTRRSDENTDKGDDHPDDGKKAPSLDSLELQLLGADVSDDDNPVQASDNQKAKGDDSRSSPASSPRSQPDVDLPDISKLISPTAPTNRQENFSGSFVGSLFSEPINFSSSPPVSIQKSQAADDLQVQATEQNKPVNDSLFNVSRYDSSSPAVDKLQADNDLQEETLAQDDSGMDSLFDMTVDFSSSLPIQDSEADDDLIEPVAMQHDSTVRNKIGERMQTLDQDIEVASVLVTDQNVKKNGSSDAQADALTSVNLNMSQDSILHVLQPVTDQTQESQATEKRIQQITEEGDALEEVMESEFHFETSRSADLPVSEPNASREERNLQPEQIIDLLFRDDEDEIVTAQESISDEDEVSNSNKNEASSKARDLGVSQPDISWVSVNSGPSQLIRADLPSTQIRPSATVPRYLEHMPLVKTEEAAQRILADRTQHVQDNVCSRFQQGSIIPPRAILATAVQLANYISQIEYEKTLSQVQSFSESKIPEKEQPRQTPNDLFKESVRDKHPDHSVEIPKESIHGKQTTTHDSQKQHQPLTPAPTSLFPRNPNPCPITPDFAPPNDALLTSYINNDTPASSTQITEEEFHRFQRRGCSRVPRAPGYDPVADLHPSSRLYNPASDNHEEYDPSEPARGLEQTRHLSGQSEETYDPNDPGKGLPFGHVIRK